MDDLKKFFKGLVVGIIVLVVIIALITGANVLFFWSIFNWLCGQVQIISGMDSQLAKGVAAIFMAIFVAVPIGLMILSFSPIPYKNKGLYRSVFFLLVAVFFFLAYFGGKDTYFNPKTGTVVKYYSIRPNGEYLFYSEPGFDPVTGDKLLPVTKTIIMKSKGWYKEPPKPYQEPVKRKAPESTYVPPSPPPPQVEAKPVESYAAPPQVSPYQVSSYKEPTPVTRPQVYTRPTPVIYTCSVRFQNIGTDGSIILNKYRNEILRLGIHGITTLKLTPGLYYWRGANDSRLNSFNVPTRDEYRIAIRVNAPQNTTVRRVIVRRGPHINY